MMPRPFAVPEGQERVAPGVSPGIECERPSQPRRGGRGLKIAVAPPGLGPDVPGLPGADALLFTHISVVDPCRLARQVNQFERLETGTKTRQTPAASRGR